MSAFVGWGRVFTWVTAKRAQNGLKCRLWQLSIFGHKKTAHEGRFWLMDVVYFINVLQSLQIMPSGKYKMKKMIQKINGAAPFR
jgi:hypothetical protein